MNFYNIIVVYCLIFRPKLKREFKQYIFNREFVTYVSTYCLFVMEKKNSNPINHNNYQMIGQILK